MLVLVDSHDLASLVELALRIIKQHLGVGYFGGWFQDEVDRQDSNTSAVVTVDGLKGYPRHHSIFILEWVECRIDMLAVEKVKSKQQLFADLSQHSLLGHLASVLKVDLGGGTSGEDDEEVSLGEFAVDEHRGMLINDIIIEAFNEQLDFPAVLLGESLGGCRVVEVAWALADLHSQDICSDHRMVFIL